MADTKATPPMTVIEGDAMNADEAAWADVADAVEIALTLPGLSPACASGLERLSAASLRCARLPPRPPTSDHRLAVPPEVVA